LATQARLRHAPPQAEARKAEREHNDSGLDADLSRPGAASTHRDAVLDVEEQSDRARIRAGAASEEERIDRGGLPRLSKTPATATLRHSPTSASGKLVNHA
jgi:hypothetical protein